MKILQSGQGLWFLVANTSIQGIGLVTCEVIWIIILGKISILFSKTSGVRRSLRLASNGFLVMLNAGHRQFMLYEDCWVGNPSY